MSNVFTAKTLRKAFVGLHSMQEFRSLFKARLSTVFVGVSFVKMGQRCRVCESQKVEIQHNRCCGKNIFLHHCLFATNTHTRSNQNRECDLVCVAELLNTFACSYQFEGIFGYLTILQWCEFNILLYNHISINILKLMNEHKALKTRSQPNGIKRILVIMTCYQITNEKIYFSSKNKSIM